MCFCGNKNLKDFLWRKTIFNNKVQTENKKGYSKAYYSKADNLCSEKVNQRNTFSITASKKCVIF